MTASTAIATRVEVPDAPRPGRGVSPRVRDATRALVEALFATDEGPAPADRIDWLCDDLDDFMARSGARARSVYQLCLFAITWLAPLHVRRVGAFHSLDFVTRAEALERMERGPAGMAVFGAKAILCFLWYEHPENAKLTGYDGKCLGGGR